MHLTDLVIRRTLLAIRGLVTQASLVELAEVAGHVLGWDAARRHHEVQSCAATLRDGHFMRLNPPRPEHGTPFDNTPMTTDLISSPSFT
jgi:glycerol-3-phosphate dehydrogenase